MTRYVLGIDGGGTKTQAVIIDEGGVLCGTGAGGPSNYDDVGTAAAQASIAQAVDAARQAAGLVSTPFAAVFLGMAGVVAAADRAAIRGIVQALQLAPDERVGVDHDIRIALAGGLSGRPGIALIAGTGSSCFGMNAAGQSWRAGGWGHLLADEGSSYWLGLEAMRAAVRDADGRGVPTTLTAAVLRQLDLDDLQAIMHRLYVVGMSRAEIAALAPLVIAAARQGDRVARSLLDRAAEELAACVLAVARQLGLAQQPCELALVGGLFRAGAIVRGPLDAAIAARLPQCRITPAELPPVFGAGLLALRLVPGIDEAAAVQALRACVPPA